jgi:hypothetical protein
MWLSISRRERHFIRSMHKKPLHNNLLSRFAQKLVVFIFMGYLTQNGGSCWTKFYTWIAFPFLMLLNHMLRPFLSTPTTTTSALVCRFVLSNTSYGMECCPIFLTLECLGCCAAGIQFNSINLTNKEHSCART